MAETKNKTVTRPYIRDMRPIKNFNKIEGEILHIKPSRINDVKLQIKDITESGMVTSFRLVDSGTDSPYHDLVMVRIDWEAEIMEYRLYDKSNGNRLMELPTDIKREDVEREKIFLAKILTDLVGSQLLVRYFADRDIPF
jgi:hypothetical protein